MKILYRLLVAANLSLFPIFGFGQKIVVKRTTVKPKTEHRVIPQKKSNNTRNGTNPQVSKGNYSTKNLSDESIIVNGVSFLMKGVQGGVFTMGATSEQGSDVNYDEMPKHRVAVSSFHIGQTEVTQRLWQAIMGNNPSSHKGDNYPVEQVSWNDCQEFIKRLNFLTGKNFRLPTEAEWEYAARGGNKSKRYKYAGSNNIDDVAWYKGNSNQTTHTSGTKSPNELGLYDMTGNVYEWCQDKYGRYSSKTQTNPTGDKSSYYHVFRGGNWNSETNESRISIRDHNSPLTCASGIGFRLVL